MPAPHGPARGHLLLERVLAVLLALLAVLAGPAWAACKQFTFSATTPVVANGTATSVISVKYNKPGQSYSTTMTITGSARFNNGTQTYTQTVSKNASISITATDTVRETVTLTQTNSTCTQSKTIDFTNAAPTVSTSFNPTSIGVNGSSTKTITLSNSNSVALTGVTFSDTFPAGLKNASPLSTTNSCGGTLTAAAGGASLTLSNGTIPANGSCSITTLVTASTTGIKTNSTGTVTSTNAAPASAASASLNVLAVSAALSTVVASPTSVAADGVTTSSITVTLRDGAGSPVAGKTVTLAAGSGTSTIAPASAVSSATGVASFTVKASTAQGPLTYTATDTTDSIVVTQTAQVTFTTKQSMSKSFAPNSVAVNGTSTLTIVIANTSGSNLTGQTFSDTYPSGLVNATAATSTLSGTGCSGTVTGTLGGNSISLASGGINTGRTCTATVSVRPTAAGSLANTVSSPTLGSGSATLTVVPISTANSTVVASPTSVAANGTSTSTITVTLKDGATAPNAVAGKVVELTASFGSSVITTVTGTTNASGVATFTVKDAVDEGPITYTARDVTDNITLTATAQVTFTALTAPTVSKTFTPSTIADAGQSILRITLTNPNTTAVNGASFTDTYPAELINDSPLVLSNSCGGLNPQAVAGGSVLDLVGGTIPASGSCYVSVATTTTTSTTGASASLSNASGAVSSLNASDGISASATLTTTAIDPALSTAVASPTSVEADGITTSTITVTLVDGAGVGVPDLNVTLTANGGTSTITGPTSTNANLSDDNGQVTFTVKASTVQTVTYTATYTPSTGSGINVTQQPQVAFTTPQSTVTAINCAATCTQALTTSTVSWGVTFNRSVTGVSASAFSLVSSGLTGAFISSVTGSGTSWTVTANIGVGSGTLGLNQTGAGAVSPALTGTFTGQVYTVLTASSLAIYRFDEASWTGTAGQVLDSSGNGNNATAVNGATTATAAPTPAISTNPGSCRYGVMTGSSVTNGYVSTPLPNLSTNFTVAGWIYSTNVATANQRILADDSTGATGYGFSLADSGSGKLRFYNRNLGASANFDSTYVLSSNTWYFVAAVADITGRQRTIYVFSAAGALLSSSSATYASGTWGTDAGSVTIGASQTSYFKGNIDELQVYPRVLNQTALAALAAQTHTCPITTGPDHFQFSHGGTGVTCTATAVTVTAHNADHSTYTGYTGTLTLSSSVGRGDWTLVSGSGALSNATANDGAATYAFAGPDSGTATLGFQDTTAETLSLNALDGGVSEASGSASAATDDPGITFSTSGFEFEADSVANAIGTQIAGKSSATAPGAQTLQIRAIKSSDSSTVCVAALEGSKTVQFGYECVSPATCSASTFSLNGSTTIAGNAAGSVSAYTNASLSFDNAGKAAFSINWNDVGSTRLYARYALPVSGGAASGNYMAGSSNTFVSRPFAYDLSITGNPAASSASGTKFITAGTAFNASARAVAWSAGADTNNDGIADGMESSDTNATNNASLAGNATTPNFAPASSLTLTSNLILPAGGAHPGITGSASAVFSNGVAAISGMRYDEVGVIEISAAQTGSYLGLGTTETAKIRGSSGYVGRFYPKRFSVAANTPLFSNRCSAGAFTYQDQPFYFTTAPVLSVTALSAQGGTTSNYTTTGFFKLSSTLTGRSYVSAASGAHPLTVVNASVATLAGSTGGTGTATLSLVSGSSGDAFTYTRAAPEAPFAASVTANYTAADLTDSDGVCLDAANDGSCDTYSITPVSGANLRYGRLAADNAMGSELGPLALPLYTQYYNGSGFTLNTADSCSTLSTAALDFGAGTPAGLPAAGVMSFAVGGGTSTASFSAATASGGRFGLSLSAPGSSNTGEITWQVNLGTAAAPWLQYDWNGDGVATDDPSARATFGTFQGPKRIVFKREVW